MAQVKTHTHDPYVNMSGLYAPYNPYNTDPIFGTGEIASMGAKLKETNVTYFPPSVAHPAGCYYCKVCKQELDLSGIGGGADFIEKHSHEHDSKSVATVESELNQILQMIDGIENKLSGRTITIESANKIQERLQSILAVLEEGVEGLENYGGRVDTDTQTTDGS